MSLGQIYKIGPKRVSYPRLGVWFRSIPASCGVKVLAGNPATSLGEFWGVHVHDPFNPADFLKPTQIDMPFCQGSGLQ